MMPTLTTHLPVPRPSYSQARENLVKAIPPRVLCLLACGGIDCRYEGPECWKLNQQVIRGIFSSWVTDDIIAMARPSNHLIEKYNIIEQFQRMNIRSVINMQLPGEHAHCGPPLDPDSGFTYSPQIFMDNDIYFYNFGMPDFGVSSLVGIIDGVKVLAFAVREGRVAVHCHAGLGRTGVLIACYLIYTLRISPSEAVHYVRIKRPRSIQTRTQISQVFDFARLLGTQLVQYPDLSLRHGAPFTLQHYLNRQALLLHGQEARTLRHTPKVVYLLCVCISCLALGLPAPPEVQAELEKRSALRTLSRTVRETLVAKQYLPLLREGRKGSWAGSGSLSSWDEPLGFLERKREVLMDKRSYSESDLSKITDLELGPYCTSALGNERHWCVQDLIRPDLRPVGPLLATLSPGHQTSKKESHTLNIPISGMKTSKNCAQRSKCTARKVLPKYRSNIEVTMIPAMKKADDKTNVNALKHPDLCHIKLCRNLHNPGPTSVARAVAKAMADLGPPGETILQRSALLQEELNSSECGWALLVTESDPSVLSCLLWTWLEKLRVSGIKQEVIMPVLSICPGTVTQKRHPDILNFSLHLPYSQTYVSVYSNLIKDPVLSAEDLDRLCIGSNNRKPLSVLKKPQRHTIYCLLSCVSTVTSLCPHREDGVLQHLIRALTRCPQEEMGNHATLMKVLKACLKDTFQNHRYLMRACSTDVTL
ncbi:protein tyrosine phosphatase domain-containing protein 1 isoform X2 [Lates calcarifer]|uniref:Protein tyrosine phosphatase domain-containing protein 1 n=1 Tax=Lates calcarifer TaxID=8187 RepID=A0AAJ7PDM9_LATCA|nr:protein tyrosine phosphatase domain-containing protein 1 isoform X2 [Lates calcarifer]